jgi:succinate dehydrogenase / fumarate reductase iron-sulfur subunit
MVEWFGKDLVIEPLSKKRAIKDMIIDKGDFWDKHDNVHPYLISDVEEHPEHEHLVTPEEAEELNEADLCIQCGACHYACPVVDINEDFFGPAAFAKAYRFEADVRDDAHISRLKLLNEEKQGVWDCVKCYECAEVCPKDVNPIDKITKLHQMLFRDGVAKSNVATRHAVGFKHSIAKRGVLDEGQLVLYSEGPSIVKHIPVAFKMFTKGKIAMPWAIPTSDNMDEIKKLIESSSTAKF